MTHSFEPPVRTLMGPGPSDVSPRVLEAMSRPTIGHLDPAFIELMDEVKRLLQFAFQSENELTMPVSAPGSAGTYEAGGVTALMLMGFGKTISLSFVFLLHAFQYICVLLIGIPILMIEGINPRKLFEDAQANRA